MPMAVVGINSWTSRPRLLKPPPPREPGANGETVDALALIAWLHRDALRKRVVALIEEQSDDADAIPRDKRPKMITDLRADLLVVELQECAAVTDDGYRAECDPRAILGLADGLPPPREL